MRVFYFVAESGRKPAEEFIKSLNVHSRDKFFYVIELLEKFGRGLAWPHSKYITDSIFELRFVSIEGAIRVLYFFYDGDKAILTNGFIKKSNKTPKEEKEIAITRREDYLNKYKGGTA